MTTARLITITAAIIVACWAPAASARPAADPPARAHDAQASTPATIAAHHEQISSQQYLAAQSEPIPLTDRTDDGEFPLVFVLVGISIPLAIGLASVVARPHTRHKRRSASVA